MKTYILRHKSLYGYAMCKYLPTNGFKWIDPNEFNLRVNILAIVQKDAFLKQILNILMSYEKYAMIILWLQIKQKSKEKCYEYYLKVTYFYNIPIGNVKKLVPNVMRTYNFT